MGKISYKPLLKRLVNMKMKKCEFMNQVGISLPTLAKLSKGTPISITTIERICNYFKCQPGDIVEIEYDEKEKASSYRGNGENIRPHIYIYKEKNRALETISSKLYHNHTNDEEKNRALEIISSNDAEMVEIMAIMAELLDRIYIYDEEKNRALETIFTESKKRTDERMLEKIALLDLLLRWYQHHLRKNDDSYTSTFK